ncbi:magnesium chelatase, partial [Brevibacillus sp. LEMMJ03]|uniref:VWA domain-containing protein n=1 Tax=Brevibacillus sp. LEMMJ03 TaxID=2595056 RepID=UPI001194CEA8
MNTQVKKGQKLIAILLACFISLSACSGEEQSTSTDSSETSLQSTDKEQAETADSNPAEETISKQTATSREEQIEALKALIPDGLTKLPETAEEFYNLPPGRFSGVSYGKQDEEIEKVLQQFPNIENPDHEIIKLYYLALLGLFAEDYPEPEEVINRIKLASFGSPEMDDPRFRFKEQYNVMIVLDASGSMGNMAGGKTRMEAAKEAIRSFVA